MFGENHFRKPNPSSVSCCQRRLLVQMSLAIESKTIRFLLFSASQW
jgi:hypothetical protein